jgi:hypothetical protein
VIEEPTGAVRCTKDLVEEALFERRRDLFTEVELVFCDTTSLYFEGQEGEIGKRGQPRIAGPISSKWWSAWQWMWRVARFVQNQGSMGRRQSLAYDREAIVAHLREQLRSGDKSLVGNKDCRRYLKVQGDNHFAIDEEQIKAEARFDGLWVLRTNTVYNAETVAHVYNALWTVEDIFRTTKSILETRPIFHRCNETIRGHVFCSFLALLLKSELERRMKFADLRYEWPQVLRGLEALQQVEATFQGKRFLLRSQLISEASAALRATGVAVPATLRELP